MKTKLPLFVIWSACVLASLFLSALAQADVITINPNAQISVTVSNSEPNLITVPDDRVTGVQAKHGVLTSRASTKTGALVFSTVSTTPFSLFIQTESGFAFSVYATPRKQSGASLIVNNREIKGSAEAGKWESSYDSYSTLMTQLISRFVNNDKPAGYVYTKKTDISLSDSVQQHFSVRPVLAWRGKQLRIVRLALTNRTSARIELNERYFWSRGVMAVSYWPRLDMLSPGGSVSVVVVMREAGGDEHQ